jgi:probable phosphoglycerate mutase
VCLVVARHGETVWSRPRRFAGHADVALTPRGRLQADALAAALATLQPTAVLSSDLSRATDTASRVAHTCRVRMAVETRLREEDVGHWQGLTDAEVARKYPIGYQRWRSGDLTKFDGREGLASVARRAVTAVREALSTLDEPDDDTRCLVVLTHSNTAIALMGRLLRLPPNRWLALGSLAPAHWSVLRGDGSSWRLRHHNLAPQPSQPELTVAK